MAKNNASPAHRTNWADAEYRIRVLGRILTRVRLLSHPTLSIPCWIYEGAENGRGNYRQMWVAGYNRKRPTYTHVITAMLDRNLMSIPEGVECHHACAEGLTRDQAKKRRACCNPAHIQLLSKAEHRACRRTFCKRGHRISDDCYTNSRGHRTCKACVKERLAEKKAAAIAKQPLPAEQKVSDSPERLKAA